MGCRTFKYDFQEIKVGKIDAKHVHIGYYKYNYMHETIQKKLGTNGLTSYFLESIDGHGVMEHKIANK